MAPDALAQVLRPLQDIFPAARYPDVLVGLSPGDDAAVYRLSDDLALVATVDFFTPVVDDPYQYGAVAAANALSDVYAMGARPVFALNICCLATCLPPETIIAVLRGGADKVAEAGAVIVGGHSVDDKEPKYGLAVIGMVHPQRALTKAGARPGDLLVLTKPLGVGLITTALKQNQARPDHLAAAVASMLELNAVAAERVQAVGAHACTDVTGFSLLGHGAEVAEKSGVQIRLRADDVPLLPGARECADAGIFPGGTTRNERGFGAQVQFDAAVPASLRRALFTPETSGGLLAAIPAAEWPALQAAFKAAHRPVWVVGAVATRAAGCLVRVM